MPRRVVAAVEARAGVALGRDVHGAHVEAVLLRGVERVAHRRHVRVGEDHPRRARAVAPWTAGRRLLAEDHVGRDARLVLAHVGEQRAAVHVADRVQPVGRVAPHRVVHLDRLARLEADRVEPDVVGVEAPADRHEQLVGPHRPAVVELDPSPRRPPRGTAVALVPEPHVHAALAQRLRHVLARERLLARDQAVGRARSASPASRASCTPAPSPRRPRRRPGSPGGPGTSFAVVASRLVQGSASRRPSIGGISGAVPVATTTALRATSVSSPTRTRRSPSSRPAPRTTVTPRLSSHGHLVRVVEVVDDLVAARQHRPDVEVAGHGLAHARDAAHLGEQLARAQQRLRGHARVERALAADQVRLDDRHLQPRLAEPPGAHLARPGRQPRTTTSNSRSLMRARYFASHGHRRRAPQAGPRRPPQALHLHRGARPAPRVDSRSFVTKELAPHADEWEETTFPDSVFTRMGELGFLGLSYPEEYGGQGGDYYCNLVLAEEMVHSNCGGLAMGVAVHTDMATPPVHLFGTEEQKQALPGAVDPGREDLVPRASPSPTRAATCPASRRARCATATSGSSTARRPTSRTATAPTTSCS